MYLLALNELSDMMQTLRLFDQNVVHLWHSGAYVYGWNDVCTEYRRG
jgi:hypothetical protein